MSGGVLQLWAGWPEGSPLGLTDLAQSLCALRVGLTLLERCWGKDQLASVALQGKLQPCRTLR